MFKIGAFSKLSMLTVRALRQLGFSAEDCLTEIQLIVK